MTLSLQRLTSKPLVSEKSLKALSRFSGLFGKLGVRLALHKLQRESGELRALIGKLPEASRHLEGQFLNFQKTLEQLSSASQELILHGQNVVNMASGRDMGDISFAAVFALFESPLDYLASTQDAMEELAVGLRGSVDAISRLLHIERSLEATVAPLGITQVMFRIQSAYLPSESRQVFSSVTDEIARLQQQIQSAFSEHVRVLSQLHGNLLQVVETLDNQMATQGRKVREKRSALSRFLTELTQEISNNADRNVELTAASQDLGHKVSRAVVALQTQDIVAQQLEHAQSGIQEVFQALDECAASNDAGCLERVAALTRVEAAQLQSVVSELQNTDRSLRDVFDGITGLLERLNGDCLMLKEFTEMTASASGGVQGLLDSLDEIRGMVAVTVATAKMAEDSVLPVRTATEGLTNTVQGVAHEMHLIALNAQIQSIQMGEGTGLDVLAAHSAEVSQATTRISMEVATKVSEVAGAVAEHSQRLSALREGGQREEAELELKGNSQEAALHRFRDQTLDEFRATGVALDRARELGGGIMALLDLEPAIKSVGVVQEGLAELRRQTEAWEKIFAPAGGKKVNLSDIESKYTMASERRVHSEAMGQGVADTPVEAIELWDEDASAERKNGPPAASASPVANTGEFGERVELF